MKVQIKEKDKKKTYNVITNWSEVTLERWVKLLKIKKVSKPEEAKRTILALSDIPERLLDKLELYHIAIIMRNLSEMQKEENSSLNEIIEVNGIEYGFHPDLDSLTLGEYADLDTYIKDIDNKMPEIMAILFRPIVAKEGNLYQIEAYDGKIKLRAEVMRNIPAEKVQDALVFFYNFGAILLPTLLSSLTKELLGTKKQ
jgi:hypothetical protein